MKRATVTLFMAVTFIVSARGQGFLNLDFESAHNLPGNPPIPNGVDVPTTNALPGWTANVDKNALSDINYVSNKLYGFSTLVELEGGSLALNGDFSVGLYIDGSISQTGLVPDDAESLQFEASFSPGLLVSLDGQNLSYSALSQGPGYTVYGANIPASMDGQMENLTFSGDGSGDTLLDNIEFSPTSIPEPGELCLIGVGAVLFGVLGRRKAAWPQKNA